MLNGQNINVKFLFFFPFVIGYTDGGFGGGGSGGVYGGGGGGGFSGGTEIILMSVIWLTIIYIFLGLTKPNKKQTKLITSLFFLSPSKGTGTYMSSNTYFGGAGGGSYSLGINNFTSVSTLDYEHDGNVLIQLIPAPAEMQTPSIQLSACGNNGVAGPTSAQCRATYNTTDPFGMFQSVDAQGFQRIRVRVFPQPPF